MPREPPPKEPTGTHTCWDGVVAAGTGPDGRGADKCRRCYYHRLTEQTKAKKAERQRVRIARLRLNVGNSTTVKHGFYRKTLQPDELIQAMDLHAHFMATYPHLDNVADDVLVMQLVTNMIRAMRPGIDSAKESELRSLYEKNVRDIMDRLGITAKQRNKEGDGKNDEFSKMLDVLRKKPTDKVKETAKSDEVRDNQPKP